MFVSEGRERVVWGMLRNKQDKWRRLSLGCCHSDSFIHGEPPEQERPNNTRSAA